ncbi:protein of unknown function DUF4283 [Macleaya cordata]|uniref:DUF4283 domain-containing protein n=1 Tax=Macleaya cordata TaxID=56857 RepID=A0A200QAJ0_MACCD|nr:protein of unknown function DUF4283 [Macleaya cordata]
MAALLTTPESLKATVPQAPEHNRQDWKKYLAVKFVNSKTYGFGPLREMLKKAWNPTGELEISEFGDKVYLIKFQYACDLSEVLTGAPRSFHDELLLIKCYEPDNLPSEYLFDKTDFWIQLHGLPINTLTPGTVHYIASKFGYPHPFKEMILGSGENMLE